MKQNYAIKTKTIYYKNVKHLSLLILKTGFLTLFGCGVKIHKINPIFGYRVKTPVYSKLSVFRPAVTVSKQEGYLCIYKYVYIYIYIHISVLVSISLGTYYEEHAIHWHLTRMGPLLLTINHLHEPFFQGRVPKKIF